MKLKRFLLRYYPPGILLEYEQAGELKTKSVDLLNLTPESDVEVLVNQIVRQEVQPSRHSPASCLGRSLGFVATCLTSVGHRLA
mmetsp:Transcript_2982/g.8482  ORF Transcript_2982/g.8482 Transcript_2982/m.8482 type:complete len:84 (-) Transcript_2982:1280-1531(-)